MAGPNGEQRRTGDQGAFERYYWGAWSHYMRDLTMGLVVLVVLVFGYAVWHEGQVRQEQFCAGDEREHLQLVNQYRDTLGYLEDLRVKAPERLTDPLNQFVIARLPDTEERARTDTAPPLCDGKRWTGLPYLSHKVEIGRPEPDPPLPTDKWGKPIRAKDVQRQLGATIRR